MNQEYIADNVRKLLKEIEPDLREGLEDTPARVARMYEEIFKGYEMDPEQVLGTVFHDEDFQEMVIVKDIEFYSHCEHHMVPFFGRAHIGYVPSEGIVGISKFARLVECFAKRLQVQERMTTQIANTIERVLKPHGVMVVIEAQHLCMSMRGIKKPDAKTITSAQRGIFTQVNNGSKAEFISLIGGSL